MNRQSSVAHRQWPRRPHTALLLTLLGASVAGAQPHLPALDTALPDKVERIYQAITRRVDERVAMDLTANGRGSTISFAPKRRAAT